MAIEHRFASEKYVRENHDWSSLKNKPFYSTAITLFEWDGNTDGLTKILAGDFSYYRIGNHIPVSDMIGSTVYFSNGETITINSVDDFYNYDIEEDWWRLLSNTISSISESKIDDTFTETGLYIATSLPSPYTDSYITKIVKTDIKTLDEKYLPDHVHSWNNIEDKPTADDALALLAEVGMIDPVVDSNGSIYIEENNVIYTL